MLLPKDLEMLRPLEKDHVLLPVGADHKDAVIKKKKAPVARNGYCLANWNSPELEGFTVDQLWNYPNAISIGIRCDNLFVEDIWDSNCPRICIENPVGALSTRSKLGKPTQYIEPYFFGHAE